MDLFFLSGNSKEFLHTNPPQPHSVSSKKSRTVRIGSNPKFDKQNSSEQFENNPYKNAQKIKKYLRNNSCRRKNIRIEHSMASQIRHRTAQRQNRSLEAYNKSFKKSNNLRASMNHDLDKGLLQMRRITSNIKQSQRSTKATQMSQDQIMIRSCPRSMDKPALKAIPIHDTIPRNSNIYRKIYPVKIVKITKNTMKKISKRKLVRQKSCAVTEVMN